MDFPHLADTQFPLLNNVNVYQYKNNFDYTRWKQNTRIRLTNVLWNSDYNDVVAFESNEARDEWFDNNPDQYEIVLTADHSVPPEGGVKLPIPYDVAARYNYLIVDVPVMTSELDPIEYEYVNMGMRRWYFFINEVYSRAPNTTMFIISLDVWTQFSNDVEINYMFLERGHAPVAATDTETYLADPINNNDYLLTPDVTPSLPSVVRNSAFIPFGNGTKYLCIISTVPPTGLASLGQLVASSDYAYGTPTYSDYGDRIGYQLLVDGIGVGDGYDYSSLLNTTTVGNKNNARVASSYYIYAILASDCYGSGTFFEDVMSKCPNFLNTVQGCFIVAEQMILHYSLELTIAGHDVWLVEGSSEMFQMPSLAVSDFGYPERYNRFAKLFTYPYASLEITDNEGEAITVRIENTGDMKCYRVTELAFPTLNMRMFFTGINGQGSSEYQWALLNGQNLTELQMPHSDWFEHCFDHDIPVFSLNMDAQKSWMLDNFYDRVQNGQARALRDYQNTVRPTNATHQNTRDTASTDDTNTIADADTLVTNTDNTANATRANMDVTIAANNTKKTNADAAAVAQYGLANRKASDTTDAANTASIQTTVANAEVTTQSATTSGNFQVGAAGTTAAAGAAIAAFGSAAVAPIAAPIAVGTGIGLISTWGNAVLGSVLATQTNQANAAVLNATTIRNSSELAATEIYNKNATESAIIERDAAVATDNNTLDSHTNMNNALMRANASNTSITMKDNSARTKATTHNNADWTHVAYINNAKQTLETALLDSHNGLMQGRMSAPRRIGTNAGLNLADYHMTRGCQIKVRTLPNAEVRQVGDWFARYGYALEQVWDVSESGLCPMEHFCYWKAKDVWVDDLKSSNNAALALITSMFKRGVTVWKDPTEVGKVSVYDN